MRWSNRPNDTCACLGNQKEGGKKLMETIVYISLFIWTSTYALWIIKYTFIKNEWVGNQKEQTKTKEKIHTPSIIRTHGNDSNFFQLSDGQWKILHFILERKRKTREMYRRSVIKLFSSLDRRAPRERFSTCNMKNEEKQKKVKFC